MPKIGSMRSSPTPHRKNGDHHQPRPRCCTPCASHSDASAIRPIAEPVRPEGLRRPTARRGTRRVGGRRAVVNILLDTHTLLWLLSQPSTLDAEVLGHLTDPATSVWVSAASAWETAIKTRIGRLDGATLLATWASQLGAMRVDDLTIDSDDAFLAGRLPLGSPRSIRPSRRRSSATAQPHRRHPRHEDPRCGADPHAESLNRQSPGDGDDRRM